MRWFPCSALILARMFFCSIVGLDGSGAVVLRRRVKRKTLIGLTAKTLTLHLALIISAV